MSHDAAFPKGSITLDDLLALNDEIVALTRAGVPLERGLVELGRDMPGRLGSITSALGERLQSGRTLSEALSETEGLFPPVYRAVVEAGLRSGRLSVALEGISSAMRRVGQVRRMLIVSLIYPLCVVTLAYLLLLFALSKITPVLIHTFESFAFPITGSVRIAQTLHATLDRWALAVPIVVVIAFVGWWYYSSRVAYRDDLVWSRWPTLARLMRLGRLASYSEVLALLIEHEVPLDQAVTLAGDACGDRRLRAGCHELAERTRRGQLTKSATLPAGLPATLAWILLSSRHPSQLTSMLRYSSKRYRRQVERLSTWMTVYLPIMLSVVIGGTITLFYTFVVLGPALQLYYRLAVP